MLAAALRRHVGDGPFQDFQQRLLHAFPGDVARDRRILVLAADLVDFVDVDDPGLGAAHVAIGGLEQLEDDVLHILADIARLSESGGVDDGEGHVEHAGQRLRQQRLARAGGPDQQDVRFRQFDLAVALAVHVDALVMVINGDRQLLLGLLLADDVLVEERLHFGGLGQMVRRRRGMGIAAVVFQDGIADRDALVADVGARIIAGR